MCRMWFKIIVEYSPGLYFHFDDKCNQLTLISGNHLIDFNENAKIS